MAKSRAQRGSSTTDADTSTEFERLVRRALSAEKRIELLKWLADPLDQFPELCADSAVRLGVPTSAIARKWCVSEPTAEKYLGQMAAANLLIVAVSESGRSYRRNEATVRAVRENMGILFVQ